MRSKITFFCFIYLLGQTLQAQIYDFTQPLRIVGGVNSSAEETNPILSKDGQTIYFVRTLESKNIGGIYDQDIWSSEWIKEEWSIPKNIIALNNKLNNAVVAAHDDSTGVNLFLLSSYETERDNTKGIAQSKIRKEGISDPVKIKMPDLDIDGKYVSYFLSDDEKILIISYEGSDSEGEEDLYFSMLDGTEWSSPEHMGSVINSDGFEISPFLCPSNDTLFFSSNGFKGEGDADIFYSIRKNRWNNWSKPINLGKKINSPKFDAYFSKRGSKVLWASNRDGKDCDVYTSWTISPPKLEIETQVINVSTFQGYDGSAEIITKGGVPPFKYNWSNGATVKDLTNLRKGSYTIVVVDAVGQKKNAQIDIKEPELSETKTIHFPAVQFEFNRWSFINDSNVNSFDSLKFVAKLLQDYPNIIIELISHTDSRGETEMNQALSENRARACYRYLTEELGIDPRRIIPVGKGETEPAIWWNKSKQARFTLSEDYINQFKSDDLIYEQLHQVNRRTEGKILRLDFDANTFPEAPKEYLQYITIPK